jgi:peptidyl-prolyl cis-trans isomerase D
MLQAINDQIKGCLGIGIVVVIGLSFSLWGIQSYLDDSGPLYAAKVNGVEISSNALDRSVLRQRQSMLQQYGGKLPIEEKVLRENTLAQMVNQQLLEGVTYDSGYRISDLFLSENIKQQFSVDGVFDRDRFEIGVSSLGMNIPTYEIKLRNDLRVKQMQSSIAYSDFITGREAKELASLDAQTRDISVLTFVADKLSSAEESTDEEIKQYYDANLQRFMVPEKLKVDYVEINSDSLSENVEVEEESIQKMYDDYVENISGREERLAKHILLPFGEDRSLAKAKLESIKQEIDSGANFAELAKKNSQDSGSASAGGDLGWIALGEMVKPFEQVLFSMDKDAVSEIVETQFGYHLIKLKDIRSETVDSLAVKRGEFEEELKLDSVASMFYDASERLASISYENPDSLDMVVDELGLKVVTTDYFSRDKGQAIAANEKVRNVAFSSLVLEEGSNSDIIEISPTHVVVIRLNEHKPASAIPLEVVRQTVSSMLKSKKDKEQTKAIALMVKSKIEAGESIDSQRKEGVKLESLKALGRKDDAKVSSPSILRSAFDVSPNQDGSPSLEVVDLFSGDVAVVVLDKVNLPEDVAQDQLDMVKDEVMRENVMRDLSSALLSIKGKANVDISRRVVDDQ